MQIGNCISLELFVIMKCSSNVVSAFDLKVLFVQNEWLVSIYLVYTIKLSRLGVMAHACHPNYTGGLGRRIGLGISVRSHP
jgi:hypothetical protein